MQSLKIHGFVHWVAAHETVMAIVITAAVALLLVCCLECTNCGCREKDDIFTHHGV
jgi:hypothetical protein